jgi:hypothetical protein
MFNEEDRLKGIESRDRKKEEGKLLKHDWHPDDKNHWKKLASKHDVRLPVWYSKADPRGIRKTLRKLGKDSLWFKDVTGFVSAQEHADANPNMPLYAFAGMMLEEIAQESSSEGIVLGVSHAEIHDPW